MLVQLLYISDHDGTIIPDIGNFMIDMRERNTEAHLSSILLSTDKNYIHLIEGSRIAVNGLYNKISKDVKHCNCTILRYIDIRTREFSQWKAEHVSMSSFRVDNINLLSSIDVHSDSITSAQAVTMIRRIHAHLLVRSENTNKPPI